MERKKANKPRKRAAKAGSDDASRRAAFAAIYALRGSFRGLGVEEAWEDDRREERLLEEAKMKEYGRLFAAAKARKSLKPSKP